MWHVVRTVIAPALDYDIRLLPIPLLESALDRLDAAVRTVAQALLEEDTLSEEVCAQLGSGSANALWLAIFTRSGE